MSKFYKCSHCKEKAVYWYAPATNKKCNRYYCEEHVPRGCTCNHRYVKEDAYTPSLNNPDYPTSEDIPFKWIKENEIWCHLDNKGREYPCCEYWYEEEGFEKEKFLEKIYNIYKSDEFIQIYIFKIIIIGIYKVVFNKYTNKSFYIRINKWYGINCCKELKFSERIGKSKYLKIGSFYFSLIKPK